MAGRGSNKKWNVLARKERENTCGRCRSGVEALEAQPEEEMRVWRNALIDIPKHGSERLCVPRWRIANVEPWLELSSRT
jgi:hypothetical protein